VNALVQQAKATWDRADEKKADAREWYIRTGKLLLELRNKTKRGQWVSAIKRLGRSERRARELMELAKGTTTVEKQRARWRKSAKKKRTKAKANSAGRPAELTKTIEARLPLMYTKQDIEEQFGGDGQLEERWQNSTANICSEIIARPAYWDKYFPGWKKFSCPSHIQSLVKEAVTVLASIAKTATKR
jgi:hypothetical protein